MTDKNYSPYDILEPEIRWRPEQQQLSLEETQQLLPPLVQKIREEVRDWREHQYQGASDTTKALFDFWFNVDHEVDGQPFQFYFAQREAIESIIYLYEIKEARDKYDLMRFDSSGLVSTGMMSETWTRYVIKAATGTGKTKVMSLAAVWSYFHRQYEPDSPMSTNILIIAPNIIVLNRLMNDYGQLKIFRDEPFIPPNGFYNKNWVNDFQITLHVQDDLKPLSKSGNLFLTNIHRVYLSEPATPSREEEFLGKKPTTSSDTNRGLDLGEVLRSDRIQDLLVLNDEAHHIHDDTLEWFKSIEDINNKMKLKQGHGITLQVDFTATPKHNNGHIFVQTISDYPLVEAIKQNLVKNPVLPDAESRAKISEKDSSEFIERYQDYIHLGYLEWKEQYEELKSEKTPILFIMTTETKEADEVQKYLETKYQVFRDSVLVIHTNRQGEIKEDVKSRQEEVEQLRQAANDIDNPQSPYKVIVSVLMLREGWDVKNVSTIVGLRPYSAESQILPEQTLGRGLRKMFPMDVKEELVVIGTDAFIEFVESIKTEGVEFQYRPMGGGGTGVSPLIIEVDWDNEDKNISELDIELPILTPRLQRRYKNLELIDETNLNFEPLNLRTFSQKEQHEIVFTDLDGEFSHKTTFEETLPSYKNVISFYTSNILKINHLVSGFNILYPKVEWFIQHHLFRQKLDFENLNDLRNITEPLVPKTVYEAFKKAIDKLTVDDTEGAEIKRFQKLSDTKPQVVTNQKFYPPRKSVFDKLVSDNSDFEIEFAARLDDFTDVTAFAKNSRKIDFKVEYQADDNNIKNYYPDFFVKHENGDIYIIETKGREDVDDRKKRQRLQMWCEDVNDLVEDGNYSPLYIKQSDWEVYNNKLTNFESVIEIFSNSEKE